VYAGGMNNVTVDDLFLGNLERFQMIDISNFNMKAVYLQIPEVRHLRFDNVEDFTKDEFQ